MYFDKLVYALGVLSCSSIEMIPIHKIFLSISSVFVLIALCCSFYLIAKHQKHMTQLSIQPKIVGIIWMVPIFSVNSFLSLWIPPIALYLDMLRDCYEAYVLYLFLALMLSYLDADEDDYKVVRYLEGTGPAYLPWPFKYCFPSALPTGRAFLRYCKFGTLQYCIFRPLATFLALILSWSGVYHESDFSPKYGYLYVVIIVNLSVLYAFVVLATFYSSLKTLLAPFHPVGKFLCIKFVIFFAFWQGIVIAALVKFEVIRSVDDSYSAETLATGLQDFLICIEMMIVSVAHLYTFSYKPFVENDVTGSGYVAVNNDDTVINTYSDTSSSSGSGYAKAEPVKVTSIRDQSGYRPPSHTTSYFPSSSSSSSSSSSTVYNTLHGQSTVIDSDTLRAPVLTGTGLRHTHPVSSSNQDPITSYNISIISDGNDNIDDNNNNSNTKSIQSQFNVEKDSTSSQNKKSGTTATATAASRTVTEVLNRHFASSSAVRDFNEAMPVVLPSNFKPSKGIVIDSDPNERLRQYRENADNSP